ncbi:SDR family NAD(P)-dependent oxidoreductase [Nocardia sp. NPDC052278]|uniref:SDR family NAD(P)-dependent oxidoreductase n=1 Tax=unclassified Nocardia TaxID=2637762 RepID=UPI0036C301AA
MTDEPIPVAVVTAAGGMMGTAIVERLAAAGYRLVVNDRRDSGVEAAQASAREAGAEAVAVAADVSARTEAAAVINAAAERFGRMDVLVNVAGGIKGPVDNPFLSITVDQWHRTMQANRDSAFHCMQLAIPVLTESGGGRIVNIGSTSWAGSPLHAHYAAAKAGLVALTRSVAAQVGPSGITVNIVAPGGTVTHAADLPGFPTAEQWRTRNPLGRPNEPGDIADAVMFLVGTGARNISGEILTVAGGLNPSL